MLRINVSMGVLLVCCACDGKAPATHRDAGSSLDAARRTDGGGVLDAASPMDIGAPDVGFDAGASVDSAVADVLSFPDAFFVYDPPATFCGPDGVEGPALPGGTVDCPDDKNREGCPCDEPGTTAACWPGLRVDRGLGLCQDGTTTCIADGELGGRWGSCEGYAPAAEAPSDRTSACDCFSGGQWLIDNISPCLVNYGSGVSYAVSTFQDDGGNAECPRSLSPSPPPAPEPGTSFSTNHLTVDCAGQFRLCFTLKAGSTATPSADDCVLAQSCTEAWYDTPGVAMDLPHLPSWSSADSGCATTFVEAGGYAELSVRGLSAQCETIDDGADAAYVFHRISYCPQSCNENPSAPGCGDCAFGASGVF